MDTIVRPRNGQSKNWAKTELDKTRIGQTENWTKTDDCGPKTFKRTVALVARGHSSAQCAPMYKKDPP